MCQRSFCRGQKSLKRCLVRADLKSGEPTCSIGETRLPQRWSRWVGLLRIGIVLGCCGILLIPWNAVAGEGGKSIRAVLHPEEFPPFQGISNADEFERAWQINKPWVLANLSHAAYFDDEELCSILAPYLRSSEPCAPSTERVPPRLHLYSHDGAQGYLAVWPDKAVLVFRGTEVHSMRDLLADADFMFQQPVGKSWIHRGYHGELKKIWPAIRADLRGYAELTFPPIPVWVTGHSMGAAMATLAGMQGYPFEAVVTFGEPRVGSNVKSIFSAKHHVRYVNGHDPAVHYPMPLGYEHHGEEIKIVDTDGPNALYDHAIPYYAKILSGKQIH